MHTPDEFNVRLAWITSGLGSEDALNAEFDRFIASIKARAWSEGWAECWEWTQMAPKHQPEPANPHEEQP